MSIEVKNINHIYAEGLPFETVALHDVSFTVDDGEFVGIIGHTGSGKSTLLQHLNGLLKPGSGEIVIDGTVITSNDVKMTEIRKKVGLVFQYPEYQLFEETVEKDVAFGPKNLGIYGEELGKAVKESIELVGLDYERIKDRSPFDLSGGQKRRVAIAGVIAMKPKILILDEPTAGLDPKAHMELLDTIKKLHKEENMTIIFVSHNMDDIVKLSDRVMVLVDGNLVMNDKSVNVFTRWEELKEIGLNVPQITEFMKGLEKRDSRINGNVFSIQDAAKSIKKYIDNKRQDTL
ncbi:MAG TPA: energy-coupling factor transporter ATPase [Anaerovoracaceae bacterium]|nr:energy-coupling factor transporter ATPase [Anaerovoracaceae bacterium]